MVINTLEGPLDVLRQSEVNLLTDLAASLAGFGDDAQDDRRRLEEVAQDLRELFYLVVIIGEFNAGKSTFVNALLGESVLPMGITPTTERIELVRYSDVPRPTPIMRGDSLREWAHPNTGAEGVAIVDTPGTGSVFQKHEQVAKDFLHRSDLVIFLLSAKRAFAQTERLYLEMAKNYGKKIILVVNQVDLLDDAERTQVRRFIEQQVKELLSIEPLLFMVSAKQSLEAQKAGDTAAAAGGVDAVRAHLRGVFNEAPLAKQKLLAQLNMARTTVQKYVDAAQSQSDVVEADTSKVKAVQAELAQQSLGIDAQLKAARADVDKVFQAIRLRGANFINEKLAVRLTGRPPSREALQTEFQDVVIGRAVRDINEATNEYVNAVVDHSRMYWRSVIDRLNQLHDVLEQELGGLDAGVYAQQRESLQEAIRIAEAELRNYSTGKVVDEVRGIFEENLNGFKTSSLAAFGGIIALIVAIATPGPLIGVGAAPLALPAAIVAAPVALVGGVAALRYYQRAKQDTLDKFNAQVDRLERAYHDALDDLTRKERDRLSQYGSRVLMPIFSRLETLSQRYDEQLTSIKTYMDRIENLQTRIEDQ